MTIKKRFLSLIFSIMLILTCLPLNALAADVSFEKAEAETASKAFSKAPVIKVCYNTSKGAEIRWKKVPGAAGYYIYRYRKADGGTKRVGKVTGENTLKFYDKQVKSSWGRAYIYSVKAFDASGALSKSSSKVTFIRLAPMKITSCSAASSSEIQLTWKCTASVNNASGYQIQYARTKADLKSGTGTFKKKVVSKKSTMKAVIKGLSANTRYYFRIRSYRNYTTTAGVKKQAWSQYSSIVSAKTAQKLTTTHYRALMVGNSLYPDPDDILDGPINDTATMAGILRNYGYTTTIRKNRSADQILSDISYAFADAEDSDVSLFYYSGHGATNSGSLVGIDYHLVSLEMLADSLKKIPGRVIIVLDSCGSGGGVAKSKAVFDADNFNQMVVNAFANADPGYTDPSADSDVPMVGYGEFLNSKFLVLTASAANEISKDIKLNGIWGGAMTRMFAAGAGCTYPGGVFGGYIPADSNGDLKLTLNEMYRYIAVSITNLSSQHVMCYPAGSSSVMMVKN